jgi:hypothetical protein
VLSSQGTSTANAERGGDQVTSAHDLAILRAELVGTADTIASVHDAPTLQHYAKQAHLHRVVASLVAVIDGHPVDERGRCITCSKRQPCPAAVLLGCYAAGWQTTGGVAAVTTAMTSVVEPRRWLRRIPPPTQ